MAGLLDNILGNGFEDPRSAAMMALAGGLLSGRGAQGLGAGLLGANQAFSQAKQDALRQQMGQFQMQQAQMAMDKAKRDEAMEMQIGAAAKGAYRSPEMARTQNGLNMGPQLDGSALPHVQSGFDAQKFISELYGINPMKAVAFEQSMAKDNSPISVAPGASLVDRKTMQPVFTAPDKADKPPSAVQEYEYAQKQGYKGSFDQYQKDQKRAGASNVSVNTGQKGLDNELKIRSDFRSEPIYKAHQDVQSAHSQITQSLNQASPAGDLAGATKLMKILDPGSVVRESELGMAMAASGLLDRAQNYAGMVMSGQKLTPTQRKDFKDLADKLHGESVKQYNNKRAEYSKFGKDYGLDGERILGPELKVPAQAGAGGGVKFLGFE